MAHELLLICGLGVGLKLEAGTEAQSQAPLMAGTDSRKRLLTLIRDLAAEKSKVGENNFSSVVFGEKI